MGTITRYRDLDIWNEGMSLCEEIYKTTETFPRQEQYGLCSQMRRAAISIPSNISEGFVRKHGKEFRHFISIALGSLAELETQIELAFRLKYIADTVYYDLVESVNILGKKITRFYQGIKI